MSQAYHLLYSAVQTRIDVLLVAILLFAADVMARRRVRQKAPGTELARSTSVGIFLVGFAGIVLAELTSAAIGFPHSASPASVLLARGAVLGFAVVLGLVILAHASRLVALRAELRTRGDIELQLQQARQAADEANRAKTDFLAVMSHEIRTPLNAVMGFANLLADTRLDASQRNYVGTITSEGARLGSLINDILDLTKIEEGRLVLERLPFAPAEIAHDVLKLFGARAQEKQIDLRLEAQLAGPLLVSGDPLRFRQILVNLVDNAVKFTPRGSVTLFLNWTPPPADSTQGRLSVCVRDTGIGIAPDKLKILFQMFMQADTSTSRRYGGTGLGLAICQRLVKLMDGEINATSTRGEGSQFSFALPLNQLTVSVPPPPPPAENQAAPESAPRVLVVDDMETNRFLLEVFLRRNGFEPELAAGGEEAIRLATQKKYDAILMDLQMPDVDGYTATQRIREIEATNRHTLIIALTASIAKGTRERCLAAGMDEHLTKPLDLKKFKSILKSLIAGAPSALVGG